MRRFQLGLLLAGLVLSANLAAAAPITLGFDCVTNNSATSCGIAEAQTGVVVSDISTTQVTFTFTNTGSSAASITDVYFDDDSPNNFLSNFSITNMTGVSFSDGASPGNLPGGNSSGFDAVFSADSNSPTARNGVNPGEQLVITFNFAAGQTWDEFVADLEAGRFRIGIHVQAFANGESEGLINNPPPGTPPPPPPSEVPEPATIVLLGSGLAAAGLRRLRKRS